MKKVFVGLLAMSFAFSATGSFSANAAVVKAGASCAKAGATKTVASKKFTCVKSGKNLVWNKGVQASKAPTAKPTQTPVPVVKLSYDNLDPNLVRIKASESVYAKIKNSPAIKANVSLLRGPSVSQSAIEPYLQIMDNEASVVAELWQPSIVNVVVFNQADADWLDSAITQAGGDPTATPTRGLYSEWVRNSNSCNMGSGGIGRLGPLINMCLGGLDIHRPQLVAHEYFHTIQFSLSSRNAPYWLIEGGATFVGAHFGFYPSDMNGGRSFTVNRYLTNGQSMDAEIRAAITAGDSDFVAARLKALEPSTQRFDSVGNSAYYLGMLASEALVAVDGWDKWIQLHIETKKLGFSEAFRKTYAMTPDEFYPKVAKYIVSQR